MAISLFKACRENDDHRKSDLSRASITRRRLQDDSLCIIGQSSSYTRLSCVSDMARTFKVLPLRTTWKLVLLAEHIPPCCKRSVTQRKCTKNHIIKEIFTKGENLVYFCYTVFQLQVRYSTDWYFLHQKTKSIKTRKNNYNLIHWDTEYIGILNDTLEWVDHHSCK